MNLDKCLALSGIIGSDGWSMFLSASGNFDCALSSCVGGILSSAHNNVHDTHRGIDDLWTQPKN